MFYKHIITTSSPLLEKACSTAHSHLAEDVRYAIYFAPHRDSAWWKFGCAWLGRDPITGADVAQPAIPALPPAYLARITSAPRRYGFHATLKPPFRLEPGYRARNVYLQAAHLASSLTAAPLPSLQLTIIDGFVALSYAHDTDACGAVNSIAEQCVSCFDNLRARPAAAELARHAAAGLTSRQAQLLTQWGYPHVFDEFRFHLTLTRRLPPTEQQQVVDALRPIVATLQEVPLMLDGLAVYLQPERDAPLVITRRYGFDGSVDIYRDE